MGRCVRAVQWDQRSRAVYAILELSQLVRGTSREIVLLPASDWPPFEPGTSLKGRRQSSVVGTSVATRRSPAPSQAGDGWNGAHYHPPPMRASSPPPPSQQMCSRYNRRK